MARKGRARRFREARELKQGFDDGLFAEGRGSLADAEASTSPAHVWDDEENEHGSDLYADDPLRIDEGGRQAS